MLKMSSLSDTSLGRHAEVFGKGWKRDGISFMLETFSSHCGVRNVGTKMHPLNQEWGMFVAVVRLQFPQAIGYTDEAQLCWMGLVGIAIRLEGFMFLSLAFNSIARCLSAISCTYLCWFHRDQWCHLSCSLLGFGLCLKWKYWCIAAVYCVVVNHVDLMYPHLD